MLSRCIGPAQTIAVNEDNPAQHSLVIAPWPAMRTWEVG